MTGPEHYRKSEDHLKAAHDSPADEEEGWMGDRARYHLTVAQVHATLAHAAAVAGLDAQHGPISGYSLARTDGEEWQAAMSGTESQA